VEPLVPILIDVDLREFNGDATPIEEEPLAPGRKHLARQGWSPGAHLR
jgi:hypothetical protein